MKKHTICSLFALLLLASMPMFAFAQTGTGASGTGAADATKPVATLQIDGGVVMLSPTADGGFVTAQPNQAVFSGERLMIAAQSAATVIYNDGCKQTYDKAGIYKIDPGCKRAAAMGTGSNTPLIIGSALGGAGVAAIIDRHRCHCDCPPVSR